MAKAVKKEREPKIDNPDAIRRLAAAKRATLPPPRPKFEAKRSPEVEEAFLDGLREGWSISRSAWAAGITETTPYDWKNKSLATLDEETGRYKDDFCVRWAAAYETGVHSLEDEAFRRATKGVEKPVYQGGVLVGTVTEHSDTLMGLMLRGKAPKTYNTERHEHSGPDGGAINMNMTVNFVKSSQKK